MKVVNSTKKTTVAIALFFCLTTFTTHAKPIFSRRCTSNFYHDTQHALHRALNDDQELDSKSTIKTADRRCVHIPSRVRALSTTLVNCDEDCAGEGPLRVQINAYTLRKIVAILRDTLAQEDSDDSLLPYFVTKQHLNRGSFRDLAEVIEAGDYLDIRDQTLTTAVSRLLAYKFPSLSRKAIAGSLFMTTKGCELVEQVDASRKVYLEGEKAGQDIPEDEALFAPLPSTHQREILQQCLTDYERYYEQWLGRRNFAQRAIDNSFILSSLACLGDLFFPKTPSEY